MEDEGAIRKRIEKDISLFESNVLSVRSEDKAVTHVIELSKMYARDSRSYLEKGEFYTSFSCISYAHGLLDAIREISK